MTPRGRPDRAVVAENRKARRDYEITETIECGMALLGAEVKSLRLHRVSFTDSYAIAKDGELWLMGLRIDRWVNQSTHTIVGPARNRRLLATKAEIARLSEMLAEKTCSLIPLRIYFKGPWAKIQLGVGRGKTHEDRREDIKKREADREIARALTRIHRRK